MEDEAPGIALGTAARIRHRPSTDGVFPPVALGADVSNESPSAASVDPFVVDLEVRFRDLDPLGHVNNAVYASYCEQARIRFCREELDLDPTDLGMVVANLEVDFVRSITYGEAVTVAVTVDRVGTSSFVLAYELEVDGETAARAETTQVAVDDDGSRPLPDDWREVLETYRG